MTYQDHSHHRCDYHYLLYLILDDYVSHLTGNTRLLMHLSSRLPYSSSKELYYTHMLDHSWHKQLNSGDSVMINLSMFTELQVCMIDTSVRMLVWLLVL